MIVCCRFGELFASLAQTASQLLTAKLAEDTGVTGSKAFQGFRGNRVALKHFVARGQDERAHVLRRRPVQQPAG